MQLLLNFSLICDYKPNAIFFILYEKKRVLQSLEMRVRKNKMHSFSANVKDATTTSKRRKELAGRVSLPYSHEGNTEKENDGYVIFK